MHNYENQIESIWEIRDQLDSMNNFDIIQIKSLLDDIINNLTLGKIVVCYKLKDSWKINYWVKKSILLYFKLSKSEIVHNNIMNWYDKIPLQFTENLSLVHDKNLRLVPGSIVRKGSYLGNNVVVMPSFINIGAYVGNFTLIDTWATIGSCAYVGKNCHISGGVGIGGVLEPIQNNPVIIEDNCFIGARSEIVEGVIVEEGSVISMGVYISSSTKIVYRDTGEIIYGKVPPYSVVVPGVLPDTEFNKPGLYCAVIVKQVDQKTRNKVAINDLLRY